MFMSSVDFHSSAFGIVKSVAGRSDAAAAAYSWIGSRWSRIQIERPCVAMSIALSRGCSVISSTRTSGKFAASRCQLFPRSSVTNRPVSAPRYRTSGLRWSSVSVLTTTSFTLAAIGWNDAPKSWLAQRYVSKSLSRCASTDTYTVPASKREGTTSETQAPLGNPDMRSASVLSHVFPPSLDTLTTPSSVPV